MATAAWQVHKFGGSSLADPECFRRVTKNLLGQDGGRQAVVVSAMSGMTDGLLNLVSLAEQSASYRPRVGRHRGSLPGGNS